MASVDYLSKELTTRSFLELSQELGVSDNAIRKHLANRGVRIPRKNKSIQKKNNTSNRQIVYIK